MLKDMIKEAGYFSDRRNRINNDKSQITEAFSEEFPDLHPNVHKVLLQKYLRCEHR